MTASADLVRVSYHFFPSLRNDLPLHSLARLVCRPCHFVKGLVEGEVVSNGVLVAGISNVLGGHQRPVN